VSKVSFVGGEDEFDVVILLTRRTVSWSRRDDRQIAASDVILLNKVDLVTDEILDNVERRIRHVHVLLTLKPSKLTVAGDLLDYALTGRSTRRRFSNGHTSRSSISRTFSRSGVIRSRLPWMRVSWPTSSSKTGRMRMQDAGLELEPGRG
jgi:G3E family GTPase